MDINEKQILGDVVAQDYRAASVFKKYGIDFCCHGNRSIREASEDKGIKPNVLLNELEQLAKVNDNKGTDFQSWPIDLLADYIEKRHHRYVENKILEIKPYLEKICQVHCDRHPELFEIKDEFNIASGELAAHMKKEEFILFPFVRKMVKSKQEGTKLSAPFFGSVENPVHLMMDEHSIEGDRFSKIEELSNHYTPPADSCNTYKVTFALLKEFEDDLHLHIHLENNILFLKAIAMEHELK